MADAQAAVSTFWYLPCLQSSLTVSSSHDVLQCSNNGLQHNSIDLGVTKVY